MRKNQAKKRFIQKKDNALRTDRKILRSDNSEQNLDQAIERPSSYLQSPVKLALI